MWAKPCTAMRKKRSLSGSILHLRYRASGRSHLLGGVSVSQFLEEGRRSFLARNLAICRPIAAGFSVFGLGGQARPILMVGTLSFCLEAAAISEARPLTLGARDAEPSVEADEGSRPLPGRGAR